LLKTPNPHAIAKREGDYINCLRAFLYYTDLGWYRYISYALCSVYVYIE